MATTSWERFQQNGYAFRFGHYFARGFDLLGKNIGLQLLFALVFLLTLIMSSIIPIAGTLAVFVVTPVLGLGPAIVSYYTDKNQSVQFSNFFDGFQKFGNVFLAYLLSALAKGAALLPGSIYLYTQMVRLSREGVTVLNDVDGSSPDFMFQVIRSLLDSSFFWQGILLIAVPYTIVGTLVLWATHFAWFFNLPPLEAFKASIATVRKRFFETLLFTWATGLIAFLGVLLFVFGVFLTYPAMLCAKYAAFAYITGLLENEADEADDVIDHFAPSI